MTSTTSVFASPAVEVTFDRVLELVNESQLESLTLEYKEAFSSGIPTTVAAMANSYGGLILVGVKDRVGPDRIAGVPVSTVDQIVNACHDRLEPPWEPEIIALPVPGVSDRLLIVVRVDPARAPRPILIGSVAHIRLHGRNAKADRSQLARLFAEAPPQPRWAGRVTLPPRLPTNPNGSTDFDFGLRSGLRLPVDDVAAWRPLSERGVDALIEALHPSPLQSVLLRWLDRLGVRGLNQFHRLGLNRARNVRLAWQAVHEGAVHHPVQAVFEAHLPDAYGAPNSFLACTLDVFIRTRALVEDGPAGQPPARLAVPALYETMEGIIATLTEPAVTRSLADLAGIDPVLLPQPSNVDFVTSSNVADLLDLEQLDLVPDAGPSRGANLVANPAYDLSQPDERREQLDSWMEQVGLDGGLRGMERLLVQYHANESRI